jgi:cysteine-rich repeat protein
VCTSGGACASRAQATACDGLQDGASCSADGSGGVCREGACVSLLVCGDGITQRLLGEYCDCGASDVLLAPADGCSGFNSDAPGAACRSDCRLGGCGDGIVDPGEACDDHGKVAFDGCNASCSGRFQKMQTPTARQLYAVWTGGPSLAYAAGDAATLIHYNGLVWSEIVLPPPPTTVIGPSLLMQIWGSGPDNVWVGGNMVAHFDGTSWVQVTVPGITDGINRVDAIWGSGPSDVYVAAGTVQHWDGTAWSAVDTTACPGNIRALSGTSSSDVFMVSIAFPTERVCHFDGTTWTQILQISTSLYVPVLSHAAGDVTIYLLADATSIYPFNGASVGTPIVPPTAIYKLVAASPDELFASQAGLSFDVRTSTWTHVDLQTGAPLVQGAATSSTNVFIVGAAGTVLH